MFKQAPFRFSFLLLIAVFFAPVSKLHAQATDPVPPATSTDTTSTTDSTDDSGLLGGFDTNMMTSDDVVTGGDPEPSGEGGNGMIHVALEGAFISLKLS